MAAGFTAAAVATMLLAGVTYYASRQIDEAQSLVRQTLAVRAAAADLFSEAQDHETGARGFALTGDERFLAPEQAADRKIPLELRRLRRLTARNPVQQGLIAELEAALDEKRAFDHELVAARRTGGLAAATAVSASGRGVERMERIRAAVGGLFAEESRLLDERLALVATREARAAGAGLLLLAAALATLGWGCWAVARSLRERATAYARLDAARVYAQGIVDTVREPLLVYDEELRLVEANRAYYRLFGGTPATTEGRLLSELAAGQPYLARLSASLRSVLADDTPMDELEVEVELSTLGRRQLLLSARRLEGRERPHLLLAVNDATDRRRADRLEIERLSLERTNRELQDFAYVASHDLQEPLRKIRAFAERLNAVEGNAELPEQVRDYLARIGSGAERMQRLIDDLLAFSRVTTKAAPFARVDLAAVVRDVLVDLEPRIEASGARIEVGSLPVIEADPTQMRQLVQNLLANALKFRRPDVPPAVRVSAVTAGTGASASCELAVADNGIGFDEKYLDRIFTIFQRLHGRNEYEGTGLGLAICRKVVERHRGRITARSRPGEGATFLVHLPVKQARTQEAA